MWMSSVSTVRDWASNSAGGLTTRISDQVIDFPHPARSPTSCVDLSVPGVLLNGQLPGFLVPEESEGGKHIPAGVRCKLSHGQVGSAIGLPVGLPDTYIAN